MRIIAGVAGGLALKAPAGEGTRPTGDRVKEALFSKLETYGVLPGALVLDLYAGSGALGLEAASRGAREVHLVDAHPGAAGVCAANARRVEQAVVAAGGAARIQVHTSRARPWLAGWSAANPGRAVDVVLLDPPYALSGQEVGELVGMLTPHAHDETVVLVERSSRTPEPEWPRGWERFASRKYGETALWWLQPVEEAQA